MLASCTAGLVCGICFWECFNSCNILVQQLLDPLTEVVDREISCVHRVLRKWRMRKINNLIMHRDYWSFTTVTWYAEYWVVMTVTTPLPHCGAA